VADLRAKLLVFGDDAALLEGLADERRDLGVGERLGDEVVVECAVITTTWVAGSRSLAAESRSSPEPSGMTRSVSTTANGVGLCRRASTPSRKPGWETTSNPSRRNRIPSISRKLGSSSTTSSRGCLGGMDGILSKLSQGRPQDARLRRENQGL
jgi:hypothetical protein